MVNVGSIPMGREWFLLGRVVQGFNSPGPLHKKRKVVHILWTNYERLISTAKICLCKALILKAGNQSRTDDLTITNRLAAYGNALFYANFAIFTIKKFIVLYTLAQFVNEL